MPFCRRCAPYLVVRRKRMKAEETGRRQPARGAPASSGGRQEEVIRLPLDRPPAAFLGELQTELEVGFPWPAIAHLGRARRRGAMGASIDTTAPPGHRSSSSAVIVRPPWATSTRCGNTNSAGCGVVRPSGSRPTASACAIFYNARRRRAGMKATIRRRDSWKMLGALAVAAQQAEMRAEGLLPSHVYSSNDVPETPRSYGASKPFFVGPTPQPGTFLRRRHAAQPRPGAAAAPRARRRGSHHHQRGHGQNHHGRQGPRGSGGDCHLLLLRAKQPPRHCGGHRARDVLCDSAGWQVALGK